MSIWLSADDVAAKLGVSRRTAMGMMQQMPHAVISGTQRKRIRVSEQTLEAWMLKQSTGKPIVSANTGSRKKIQRREA